MPLLTVSPIQSVAWPADLPAFVRLEAEGELVVPLAAGRQGQVIAVRPAGTRVSVGEILTQSIPEGGHIPVAPVAGTLGAVRQVTLVGGASVPAVVITPDPAAKADSPSDIDASRWLSASREDLADFIHHLQRGGVHADRRSSPDLIGQLLQVLRRPVDTILVSLLDSDPPLRLSAAMAVHEPSRLIQAIAALRAVCGATRSMIVIDDSMPARWLADVRALAREARVRIVEIENDYPQSDPTILLHHLWQRRLRPARLPVEQGVLLLDGPAAAAVGVWLTDGQPMSRVAVGVFDHVQGEQHYALVPVGTTVSTLLAGLEIDLQHTVLRSGAMLRDIPTSGDHVIGGGELILHVLPRERQPAASPCIRCGWCVQGCPTRIQPAGLLEAAQREDLALADHYRLESCIECGICSWVCPAHLPILDGIRFLRELRSQS